jgi:murein peptide amidase A
MRRAGLAGIAAAALSAIALALVAGPSQGPGVGTIASARADNDDAAPVNEVVGRSVQGRPIVATRYGDATSDRTVLVVGVIHGDERAGLRIVRALRRRAPTLEGAQLWVIPTVNPDGLRAHTRKNAHGVDLNRNYPYRWRDDVPHSNGYYPGPRPASEPETRAVIAFAEKIRLDLVPPALGRRAGLPGQAADRRGVRQAGRDEDELQGQGPARDRDHLGDARLPRQRRIRRRDALGRDQRRLGGSPGPRRAHRGGGPLR